MSRQLAKRLYRLEMRTAQARRCQLILRNCGEPEPVYVDPWALVVWLHRPWCTTIGHPEGCGPRSLEEEAPYASL